MTKGKAAVCCRRFARDEGGNFAIIAALLMVPLMVAVGGGVDYAEARRQHDIMQEAADAAALAAAPYPDAERQEVANAVYFSNYPGPLASSRLAVRSEESGAVTVNVSGQMPTNFLRLIGMNEVEIGTGATAIASVTPDRTVTETVEVEKDVFGTVCMMSLATSGAQTLLVNSPARVDAHDCEVQVKSHANDAFIFNTGANFDAQKFCVEGTAIKRGSTAGVIAEGCETVADTLAGTLPQPNPGSCTYNNWTPPVSNAITMMPGTYCGWTNFNGRPRITMMPGLYIIKDGGWNLNDGVEIRGDGVSIYFAGNSAGINMNGNMTLDISAPRTGPYAGILMFQQPSLQPGNLILNGRNGQHLEGLIYLPTQNIYFKSRSMAGKTDAINVVARTFIIDGESDWRFKPYDMYAIDGSKTVATVTETRETIIPGQRMDPYLIR